MPELPPNLENLQCENNQLSQFPDKLPTTLSFIDCSNNPNLRFEGLSKGFQLIEENIWKKI